MKKTKTILLSLLMLIINSSFAQVDTIYWDNGNYSLLSELDKVWIMQRSGPTIKKAKIHTIDLASGKIEYLYDGVFHDVLISNVVRITPGKDYNQELIFRGSSSPIIKVIPIDEGIFYEKENFKYYKKKKPDVTIIEPAIVSTPSMQPEIITKEEDVKPITESSSEANAQLIYGNGKRLDVKLISINSETVSYKRLDLLNGPLYIIGLSIPGTLRRALVTSSNGFTTIDFRK